MLAIPVSRGHIERTDDDGDGYRETRTWVTEELLAVLAIDADADADGISTAGVDLVAEIAHDTPLRRSGYIDDKLYAIATDAIQVVDVANPQEVIGQLTIVDPADAGDEEDFPASVTEGPLTTAVAAARTDLAEQLQVESGGTLLVTAEAVGPAAADVFQMVLRAGDTQYLYAAHGNSVTRIQDTYQFSQPAGSGTWHAIRAPLSAAPGDMNVDGQVNFGDLSGIVMGLVDPAGYEATFGGPPTANGDIDGDGAFNFNDLDDFVALITAGSQLASPTPGDLNHDGTIDFNDLGSFVLGLTEPATYQDRYGVAPTTGDINADGRFDFGDLAHFVALLTGSAPAASAHDEVFAALEAEADGPGQGDLGVALSSALGGDAWQQFGGEI